MISKTQLKEHRLARGLTQEDLSDESGISIRTIQRIENGNSDGSPYTLRSLAKALNVKNEDLLLRDSTIEEHPNSPLSEVKLLNLSAIAILIIPFGNILLPIALFLFGKGKDQTTIHLTHKILSFQILYTLVTILLMIIVPIVLIGSFDLLKGSKVPLSIPVYYGAALFNVFITLRTASLLSRGKEIL